MIFGPICHVGCFNASAAVTSASAASERPRNGPPDAVRIRRRTSLVAAAVQALMDGVVLAVDGQHRNAFLPRRIHHDAAGHDQHFLVGERDRLARLDRAQHRVERRGARTTRTARCRRRDARRSRRGPRCRRRRSPRAIRRARRAACPSPRRSPSPPRADGTRGSASPSRATLVAAAIATTSTRSDASARRRARSCRSIPSSREWRCASQRFHRFQRFQSSKASFDRSSTGSSRTSEPRQNVAFGTIWNRGILEPCIRRFEGRSRRPARRRAARRCGRGRRHGRESACRCPSCRRRASASTRTGRR